MELKEYLEMSTVPDFFFLWEVESRTISYLSPSFYKLRVEGKSKEEIVRDLIHPDSVEYFDLVMDKLHELNFRIDEEIRANNEKYDFEWLRLKTFPFYNEDVVYKVAIQFTYIKKQKDKLIDIKKGEGGTESMLEAVIQDLWGTISNIISFAKIMETELKEHKYSDFEHYIANIVKIGFETKDVLGTVLNLREIEKGQQELTLEKIELQSFIIAMAEVLKTRFLQYDIEISYKIPDEPIYMQLDRKRFSQVFENLAFNLAKSTKPGETIKISLENLKDKVIMSICNLKNEIDALARPESDEGNFPGYYIKPEHDIENPSGLEITRKVIELHKGKIWMERKIGEGSIFFIELPKT